MLATVVGIKKLDFSGKDGQVKRTMFYLNFPGENVEGNEVGSVSWDEIAKKKSPPEYSVGEIIEVEYNKYGKLVLVEQITEVKKGA